MSMIYIFAANMVLEKNTPQTLPLDNNILLHKLKYYGIEGTALRLFESYLNERQQYVDLDGTN